MKRQELQKKKAPPRPPPPRFNRYRSVSQYSLNQPSKNLIEWSPPGSPLGNSHQPYGGSISSSYSSSASSLSSNKKSTDGDFSFSLTLNWAGHSGDIKLINPLSPPPIQQSATPTRPAPVPPTSTAAALRTKIPIKLPAKKEAPKPTIIRGAPIKNKVKFEEQKENKSTTELTTPNGSPPMPKILPPSPPLGDNNVITPYGIALFNFPYTQPGDLPLQVDDVVLILRRIDKDWLYGSVDDKEGMFPESFINIEVPLPGETKVVTALYEFNSDVPGDLKLTPGQKVRVIKKINEDWLYGESNGKSGQFPSNFIC